MSAEDVLKKVLLRIGIDDASAQLTSSDLQIRQILDCMNAAGDEVAARAEWSGLHATWTVPGSRSSEPLPSDFREVVKSGAVRLNKSGYIPVKKCVSAETWAMLLARPSAQPFYHLTQGAMEFSPALDSDGAIVRYISKSWVSGGKAAITENSDTMLVPERLLTKGAVWRWLREKGMPYDDILAEFEADLISEIKADRGAE